MHCVTWTGTSRNEVAAIRRLRRKLYQESTGTTLRKWAHIRMLCTTPLCIATEHIVATGTLTHFWSLVDIRGPADCWPWTAGRSSEGYGRYVMHGGTLNTHRIAWEDLNGPIPDGLSIDHLCRNRACQNPAHMEPVSPEENTRRGSTRDSDTCPSGHPYSTSRPKYCPTCQKASVARYKAKIASGEHTPTIRKAFCVNGHDKEGRPQCRQCMREASRRWQARKRDS